MIVPEVEVLVVGAGPSGLTAANVLAASGINFAIVDRRRGPVEESRAALVHTRTLELWDKLGIAEEAIERGIRTDHVDVHERGRPAAGFKLAGRGAESVTPFPFALTLPQDDTERLLADALVARGARVIWDTEVVGLSMREGRTVVGLHNSTRGQTVDVPWIIGADGAGSTVRHDLGIGFTGETYELTGLLADVAVTGPSNSVPEPGTLLLNLTGGGFVGIGPLPNGLFRLFGAVPPSVSALPESNEITQVAFGEVSPRDLQVWLDEFFVANTVLKHVEWTSLFKIHSRLAESFRWGSAFLIGDAAHVHSPAGGQGMNLGIGDAYNLAWKLAAVINREVHLSLLDSYEAERRPIARTVLRTTDRGFHLEATDNRVISWLRTNVGSRLIGPLSHLPVVQTAIFRMFSQLWIHYRNSPAVAAMPAGRPRGPMPGDRAPEAPLSATASADTSVFDLLSGVDHHLLLFEGPTPDPDVDKHRSRIDRVLQRYAFNCLVHVISSQEAAAMKAFGIRHPHIILVRPDGHISFTGTADDPANLAGFLSHHFRRVARRCN